MGRSKWKWMKKNNENVINELVGNDDNPKNEFDENNENPMDEFLIIEGYQFFE